MANICGLCATDAKVDVIKCYGMCGKLFHLTCLSSDQKQSLLKKALLPYLNNISGLHWYCDNCVPHTLNGLVKSFADCVIGIGEIKAMLLTSNSSSTQTPPLGDEPQIASEPSSSAQMSTNQTVPGESSASNDEQSEAINEDEFAAPPVNSEIADEPMDTLPAQVTVDDRNDEGNGNVGADLRFNPFSVKRRRFGQPVQRTAKRQRQRAPSTRMFVDQIRCTKLMKRGRGPHAYTFISFKLTVPSKFFSRVTNPSIWPEGVTANEYVRKQSTSLAQHTKVPNSHAKNGQQLGALVHRRNSLPAHHQPSHSQSSCAHQPRSVQARLHPCQWISAPQPNRVSCHC